MENSIINNFSCARNNFQQSYLNRKDLSLVLVQVGSSNLYCRVAKGELRKTLKNLHISNSTITGFTSTANPNCLWIKSI